MASEHRLRRSAVAHLSRVLLEDLESLEAENERLVDELEAVDALRQLWPEVVEALGQLAGAHVVQGDRAQMVDPDAEHRLSTTAWLAVETRTVTGAERMVTRARDLLTRARAITPEEPTDE